MTKLISIITLLLFLTGCTTLTNSEQEERIQDDPQTLSLIIKKF